MSLIRIGGPAPLPVYVMDLALSEGHSFPGEATKYPVEKGADFTDHIRELPDEITLECIVSDTPIGEVAADPTRQPTDNPDGTTSTALPSAEALQRLRELKALKQPVRIETSLGVFPSMAFTDLDVPVDKDKSPGDSKTKRNGALFFTAKFTKVVVVTNKRTRVRVRTTLAGAGGQGRGKSAFPSPIQISRVIQWKHGEPPGAPWHIPNLVEPVTVVYTTQTTTAPKDRVALMNEELSYEISGAGSGLIQFLDSGLVTIAGARLIALHRDLRRDRDQLNAKTINDPRFDVGGAFGPTGAQGSSSGTRSNLPRGIDVSKWTWQPSGPFAAPQAIGPNGPTGTGVVLSGG